MVALLQACENRQLPMVKQRPSSSNGRFALDACGISGAARNGLRPELQRRGVRSRFRPGFRRRAGVSARIGNRRRAQFQERGGARGAVVAGASSGERNERNLEPAQGSDFSRISWTSPSITHQIWVIRWLGVRMARCVEDLRHGRSSPVREDRRPKAADDEDPLRC